MSSSCAFLRRNSIFTLTQCMTLTSHSRFQITDTHSFLQDVRAADVMSPTSCQIAKLCHNLVGFAGRVRQTLANFIAWANADSWNIVMSKGFRKLDSSIIFFFLLIVIIILPAIIEEASAMTITAFENCPPCKPPILQCLAGKCCHRTWKGNVCECVPGWSWLVCTVITSSVLSCCRCFRCYHGKLCEKFDFEYCFPVTTTKLPPSTPEMTTEDSKTSTEFPVTEGPASTPSTRNETEETLVWVIFRYTE